MQIINEHKVDYRQDANVVAVVNELYKLTTAAKLVWIDPGNTVPHSGRRADEIRIKIRTENKAIIDLLMSAGASEERDVHFGRMGNEKYIAVYVTQFPTVLKPQVATTAPFDWGDDFN